MKKYLVVFIMLINLLVLTSCTNPPTISIDETTYYLNVGDKFDLNIVVTNCDSPKFTYEIETEGIIEINDKTITAISEGTVSVIIKLSNYNDVAPIEILVDVYQPSYVKIERERDEMKCGESLQLSLTQVKVEGYIRWSSENRKVATISKDGLVTAIEEGTTLITASCGGYIDEFTLTVTKPLATEIIVEDLSQMEVGSLIMLECNILPSFASQDYSLSSNNKNVIDINGKSLLGKSLGEATITITTTDGTNLTKSINIKVIENADPVINCDTKKITINWNDMDAIYQGITAIDNCDGDITNLIKISDSFDCKRYGVQVVDYIVSDRAGNEVKYTREIEVKWNYTVKFIGHAGSYFGVANSEEAIRYALEELHYQAVEIDLKQTSDGVFVLSHDSIITTSNGTKIEIANVTWAELQKYEIKEVRNSGIPQQEGMVTNGTYISKVCTLETYLNLCKEYNALAVIELKTSNGISNYSQSRMQALMDQIESQGMLKNVIFLTSQYKCLEWVKTNGYEYIECQYLVGSCEDQAILDECIKYDFTVSINVTDNSNSVEWLQKYKDAGLKISTYTFSQWNPYSQVQEWIDLGVDYVTCDFHMMEKLNLPLVE